jgi:3D-(3,5/4)-trihydroxycyclohexane-1,2-dione acylhydrolase (decyclizing)
MGELKSALETARGSGGVKVIVVPVSLDERLPGFEAWWDVPIAAFSGQEGVKAARADYERGRERQRPYFAPSDEASP